MLCGKRVSVISACCVQFGACAAPETTRSAETSRPDLDSAGLSEDDASDRKSTSRQTFFRRVPVRLAAACPNRRHFAYADTRAYATPHVCNSLTFLANQMMAKAGFASHEACWRATVAQTKLASRKWCSALQHASKYSHRCGRGTGYTAAVVSSAKHWVP
ncbi:hypothetical protein THASP1DRAFT_26301 [Thamnocephalis sphaerospora]|uniref:Uncharacterized protein n=1 Tax=Thamnocephalis sphaerospora TaxID=78915 RepID=A0A4P9XHI2_9FUNG|nr:hypothetical protein THASP1DRAFT_26301 [Thamnocephalis sphaerospora]|eukprot:RKP05154.1 hypothetical protein THASP1DRAFT_26301 [Thamnocephalis sphaerospora]